MDNATADDALVPYQLPFPADALSEVVIPRAIPDDERMWAPQANNVWFRPSLSQPVDWLLGESIAGATLRRSLGPPASKRRPWPRSQGTWRYLEHDWIAEEGSYVFEPPGETHTLVVPDGVEEMITYFQVNGVMYYVDPWGHPVGYEDVFTKIDMCRKHLPKWALARIS